MSDSIEKSIEVTTETIRWLFGGCLITVMGLVKLEFSRIWRAIDDKDMNIQNLKKDVVDTKMNIVATGSDTGMEFRIKALEEAQKERATRDKELFKLIGSMNEKLHRHIQSADDYRSNTETQTLRRVIREEFSKNK